MNKFRLSIFGAACLAAICLGGAGASAQMNTTPQQDCLQQAGNQGTPQDVLNQNQSCNTVFSDVDLGSNQVTTQELISRIVESSPSLGDGPYVRVDLGGFPLDYISFRGSTNSATQQNPGSCDITLATMQAQIGTDFNPGFGLIDCQFFLTNKVGGNEMTLTILNRNVGNQLLNACPDGVVMIDTGGKDANATFVGDIDMWRDDNGTINCGLTFQPGHTINELVVLWLVGPSGHFSLAGISNACGVLNTNFASQQGPVTHIIGGYSPFANGNAASTNLTACFGDAAYCDSSEGPFSDNRCSEAEPVVGAPQSQPSVTTGAPETLPAAAAQGLATAAAATDTNDQTTTFGGTQSAGSLFSCCSFLP